MEIEKDNNMAILNSPQPNNLENYANQTNFQ